jgi:hydroxymethylbilane synthase
MSGRGRTLRLGTRTSNLARRQAERIEARLTDRRYTVETVGVETDGDQLRDELIHRLGTTGAFVHALDEGVIDGDLDAAVHSLKDIPTEGRENLVVAAIPERGPANDVLVTPDGRDIDALPDGAVVGTSSLRRRAQLLAERPDLTVEPLRGNVDTRVEKLLAPHLRRERDEIAEREEEDDEENSDGDTEDGDDAPSSVAAWKNGLADIERSALDRTVDTEYDAIVIAAAGLHRLGLLDDVATTRLNPEQFVPAPGQGALAVTMRDGDLAEAVHGLLDDPRTRVETTVERTILAELGGGCVAPLGVYAVVQGEHVHTIVRVLDRDGEETLSLTRDLPIERHRAAARTLATELEQDGAADIIARATEAATE